MEVFAAAGDCEFGDHGFDCCVKSLKNKHYASDSFFGVRGCLRRRGVNLLVQRHPINSALSLVVVMAAIAGRVSVARAEFVAAVQVIVYAGAIMDAVCFCHHAAECLVKKSAAKGAISPF